MTYGISADTRSALISAVTALTILALYPAFFCPSAILPPPSSAPLPTSMGKKNHSFVPNPLLPTIAVVTLNGQAGPGAGIGLARKSAWMHNISYINKAAYCQRWGYDLIIEDNTIVNKTRNVQWSKVPILRKWLPKYQWLLWMDMDAFFMRFDLPLTDMLDNDYDLVVAKDWNGINTGVFLLRSSPWSFKLLDQMWHAPKEWWDPWEEQSALMALLDPKKNGAEEAAAVQEHVKHPRQREMNSYGKEFAYNNRDALYQDGDRIVHFPNCKGFASCKSTIERFFLQMVADNHIENMTAMPVPGSLLPTAPPRQEYPSPLPRLLEPIMVGYCGAIAGFWLYAGGCILRIALAKKTSSTSALQRTTCRISYK